jgi:hypothetical protein
MKIVLIITFTLGCSNSFATGLPNPQGFSINHFGQGDFIIFDPLRTVVVNRNGPQLNKPMPPLLPTENKNNSQVILTGPPSVGSDDENRTRLCPRTPTREYRFDLEAQKCSKITQQSHCGKNMLFYGYEDNKVYGHCDCNYETDIPLVYHERTKRCYYVYQQAYCKEDQWLELDRKAQPMCSGNKCYNSGRNKFGQKALASRDVVPEYVPLRGNGKCVQLNKPSEHCQINQVVMFLYPKQFYPSCRDCSADGRHLSVTGTLSCKPGTYLSITGQCQPPFDFDFD